jgi:hypothetical protein
MDNPTQNIRLSFLLYLLFPTVLLVSCFVVEERIDKEKDINDAKLVTNEFLNHVKNQDFIKAIALYSGEALRKDSVGLISNLTDIELEMGRLLKYDFAEGKSSITIDNGTKIGEYKVVYTLTYDKGNRQERFTLITEPPDQIKISERVVVLK